MPSDHIAERLRQLQAQDLPTHGGRTLAYVYDSGLGDVDEVGRQALAMFASSNGLDPTVFPSLLQMERDLVAFARSLVDGPRSEERRVGKECGCTWTRQWQPASSPGASGGHCEMT